MPVILWIEYRTYFSMNINTYFNTEKWHGAGALGYINDKVSWVSDCRTQLGIKSEPFSTAV